MSHFYQDLFGRVPVLPEQDFKVPDLGRGTGISGAELHGEHLRLPEHNTEGPTRDSFNYNMLLDKPKQPSIAQAPVTLPSWQMTFPAAAKPCWLPREKAVGEVVTLTNALGKQLTWVFVTDLEGNILELQSGPK